MRATKPAILGGAPRFEQFVPILYPNTPPLDDGLLEELSDLFRSGMLTKGKHLSRLEALVGERLGVAHAIAVSSCTVGLLLVYDALGLSGEVIVPSFTFMATVHPLMWVGAQPEFVDVDPNTWCLDPNAVRATITDRTTGIVAVHNFGNPAAVSELEAIARSSGVPLVFDSAHAFGSLYRGSPIGGFGAAEVFSLTPTKPVVAGEGGIIATNDADLADHVRLAREYGNPGDYGSEIPGLNARMAEFNALVARRSLDSLEDNIARRLDLAKLYTKRLGVIPGITFQDVSSADRSTYKDLSVRIDEDSFGLSRDELAAALRAENIDTRKYHDPPVHTHKSYRHLYGRFRKSLPVTDHLAPRCLSLPIWSRMDPFIVEEIANAIERLHVNARHVREALSTDTSRSH